MIEIAKGAITDEKQPKQPRSLKEPKLPKQPNAFKQLKEPSMIKPKVIELAKKVIQVAKSQD